MTMLPTGPADVSPTLRVVEGGRQGWDRGAQSYMNMTYRSQVAEFHRLNGSGRNDALFKTYIAVRERLLWFGAPGDELAKAREMFADLAQDAGLPAGEIKDTISSVERRAKPKEPRGSNSKRRTQSQSQTQIARKEDPPRQPTRCEQWALEALRSEPERTAFMDDGLARGFARSTITDTIRRLKVESVKIPGAGKNRTRLRLPGSEPLPPVCSPEWLESVGRLTEHLKQRSSSPTYVNVNRTTQGVTEPSPSELSDSVVRLDPVTDQSLSELSDHTLTEVGQQDLVELSDSTLITNYLEPSGTGGNLLPGNYKKGRTTEDRTTEPLPQPTSCWYCEQPEITANPDCSAHATTMLRIGIPNEVRQATITADEARSRVADITARIAARRAQEAPQEAQEGTVGATEPRSAPEHPDQSEGWLGRLLGVSPCTSCGLPSIGERCWDCDNPKQPNPYAADPPVQWVAVPRTKQR